MKILVRLPDFTTTRLHEVCTLFVQSFSRSFVRSIFGPWRKHHTGLGMELVWSNHGAVPNYYKGNKKRDKHL